MGAPAEGLLLALLGAFLGAAGLALDGGELTSGALAAAFGATGLGTAGAWVCARRLGLAAWIAAPVAAAYGTSGPFQVPSGAGAWAGGIWAAALLPWVIAGAPEGRPGGRRLGLVVLSLALAGPRSTGWGLSPGRPDLVAIGILLAACGAALVLRRSQARHARELALGLTVVLAALLWRRGPDPGWSLALLPTSWGTALAPGADSPASAFVSAPVLLLAGACLIGARDRGRLGALVPVSLLAWLVAFGVPGLADTWRALPLLGEVSPRALAPLGTLGLALLAGLSLARQSGRERWVALALAVPLAVLAPPDPAPRLVPGTPDDLITLAHDLGERPAGPIDLSGWLRGDLPPGPISLRLTCVGRAPIELRARRGVKPPGELAVPPGVVEPEYFSGPSLDARRLPPGAWTVIAVVHTVDRSGAPLQSSRYLGAFLAGEAPVPGSDIPTWVLALVVLVAPARGRWRWLFLGVVLAQGWLVARTFLVGG
jgi:hypothetical protein